MQRPGLSSFLFILLLLLIPWSVRADTFYVGQSGNADDANAGSTVAPLRTIYEAIQRSSAGDTIIVRDGDYRLDDAGWGPGVVPVTQNGLRNNMLRLVAARGAKPVVRSFLVQNARFIRIQGFSVQGIDFSEHMGWMDMPVIVRDPQSGPTPDYTQPWATRESRIRAEFERYFSLEDRLNFSSGFDLENSQNIELVSNTIEGFWAGVQCRGCSNIKINTNMISHCVNGVFTWLPAPGLSNGEIRANVISQCLDNGIDLRQGSQDVIVADNQISFSGRSHISLLGETRNIQVVRNNCHYGGYYSETMEFPGSSGISVHSSLDGIILKDNTVAYQVDPTHIDGNGIAIDNMVGGSPVIVQANMTYRVMGDGITLTESPNNIIRANMFLNSGWQATAYRRGGGIKLARESDIGNRIVNNVLAFNRAGGILGEDTIGQQAVLDGNTYYLDRQPIMWDSYHENQRRYFRFVSLRVRTGWESGGMVFGPLAY